MMKPPESELTTTLLQPPEISELAPPDVADIGITEDVFTESVPLTKGQLDHRVRLLEHVGSSKFAPGVIGKALLRLAESNRRAIDRETWLGKKASELQARNDIHKAELAQASLNRKNEIVALKIEYAIAKLLRPLQPERYY